MFHTNVKADSFSGSNCDQRHLAVVGDESLIVVARSFPGFEKTSIYIVTDKNRKRLKTINGGWGSIVASNKEDFIIEIAIDWAPKPMMEINQTLLQIDINKKAEEKILSFTRSNDYSLSLIRDQYCAFNGKLYYFDSGDLLDFNYLSFCGPPVKNNIQSTVKVCEQFETALLLFNGNVWTVFDGESRTNLYELDNGYDSQLNLIKIEDVIFISDRTQLFCYYISNNQEVTKTLIYPEEGVQLQSSIFYQDGVVFSIWGECLYSYSISTRQWERLFQFNQNDIKGYTLNESEIAICDNCLYLVLQTQKTTTKADLFFCDLRNLDEQDETLGVKRLMRVRKTAFFE